MLRSLPLYGDQALTVKASSQNAICIIRFFSTIMLKPEIILRISEFERSCVH